MITIPSLGMLNIMSSDIKNNSDLPQKSNLTKNGSVLDLLLGNKDNSNRGSREGSMGPLSRQSSNASVSSICSDAGSSQFFEVLYLGKIKSVSHRKAPPAFIDEVLEKFRAHNKLEQLKIRQTSLPLRGGHAELMKLSHQSSIDELGANPQENRSNYCTKLVDTREEEESTANNTLSILQKTEEALQTLSNQIEARNHQTLSVVSEVEVGVGVMRSRAASGSDLSPLVQKETNNAPGEPMRGRASSMGSNNKLKRVSSLCMLDSSRINPINENNRTMLLQISRCDVKLISPDRKSVLLSKIFRDISHCSQGVQNPDNFGFICRDAIRDNNVCYVFKCQNSSVADEIMSVLKLTCPSVGPHQKRILGNNNCEHCPTIWLQRLITEVAGLSDTKANTLLKKRISSLPDTDQQELMAKYKGAVLTEIKEHNDLLLLLLKAHCETRQMTHEHDYDNTENRSEFNSQYFDRGSGAIFQKAKRSLTNSFDQLLKRKNKEEAVGAAGTISPETNEATPSKQVFRFDMGGGLSQSPLSTEAPSNRKMEMNRPRSSTLCSSHLDTIKKELLEIKRRTSRQEKEEDIDVDKIKDNPVKKEVSPPSTKSPIMNIFLKVGNPSHQNITPLDLDRTPSPRKTGSWRQAIFQQVKTPNQTTDYKVGDVHQPGQRDKQCPTRTREQLRQLWRKAINQQILLIRMEKENRRLRAHQEGMAMKRMKLNYEEIVPCSRIVIQQWEAIITGSPEPDYPILAKAVERGVSKSRRGEAWQLLVKQRNFMESVQPPWCRLIAHDSYTLSSQEVVDYNHFSLINVPYEELLYELTSHQHAIIIDLGRTFPTLKYYQAPLGPGQLALYNLLKAYSLLDSEVGYCQGLSFIAGVLLLHLDENEAYYILRYLMLDLGLRRQYLPDMAALQTQLYQMARLLRDLHRDLYEHLEENDVSPTLYAAPWFLTLFASQFPLGFVVRVFDVIFLCGMSMIFRIGVALLADHKDMLMQCRNFEQLMDYFKTTLPFIGASQLERVIHQALELDISKQLAAYEVEYHMMQEEVVASIASAPASPKIHDEQSRFQSMQLQESNANLQKQVRDLQAQVQQAERKANLLEVTLKESQITQAKSERQLRGCETERSLLVQLVCDLMKNQPHNREVIVPPPLVHYLEELYKTDDEGLVMRCTKKTEPKSD